MGASCPCFPSMVSSNSLFRAYDMSCMLFCEIMRSMCLALWAGCSFTGILCRQSRNKSCLTQEPTLQDKWNLPIRHLHTKCESHIMRV